MKSEYFRTIIQRAKGSIPTVKPRPRFRFEPGNLPNLPDTGGTGDESIEESEMQFMDQGKNRPDESAIDEQTGHTGSLKKNNSRKAFTMNPEDPEKYPGSLFHHQPSVQGSGSKKHQKKHIIQKNIPGKQNFVLPDTLKNQPGKKSTGKDLPGTSMKGSDEQGEETKETGKDNGVIIPSPAQSVQPRIKKREIHGNESHTGEEVDNKEGHLRHKSIGLDKKNDEKDMKTPGLLKPPLLRGKKQGEKHPPSKKDPGIQVSGQSGLREREDTLSINISIGKVLIQAVPAMQPQQVKKKSDRSPAMSLEEYLKKVKGR